MGPVGPITVTSAVTADLFTDREPVTAELSSDRDVGLATNNPSAYLFALGQPQRTSWHDKNLHRSGTVCRQRHHAAITP